jgi:hypothetical protein
MASLPCKNPNCNSYGSPHPNCKCYGGMKDGGEVESFCSKARMHGKDCQYFADGGDTLQSGDVIPPNAIANQANPPLNSGDVIPSNLLANSSDQGLKSGDIIPQDQLYSTGAQQAIAGVEGFGRGLLGPAEDIASKLGQMAPAESGIPLGEQEFGFTPQDIAAREQANPATALGGQAAGLLTGALTGTGIVGAAGKAGEAAAQAANLGKIGSSTISSMISNGLIQSGDEAGKWLLGQGNPQDAVGAALTNVGAASLLGGAGGALGSAGSKLAETVSNNQFVGKLKGFLTGFGAGAQSTYNPEAVQAAEKSGLFGNFDPSFGDMKGAYETGKSVFKNLLVNPVNVVAGAGAYEGYEHGGFHDALRNFIGGELIGHGVTQASKNIIVPVITKALANGTFNGLSNSLQHGINAVQGNNLIDKGVNSIFTSATTPAVNYFSSEDQRLKQRDDLDEQISSGGVNQNIQQMQQNLNQPSQNPGFADGGEVETDSDANTDAGMGPVLHQYPEQNVLLGMAKTRISNYLNSIRPPDQKVPALPFDDLPDQTQAKKSYNKALDIANKPLSILQEVKNGTIDPEHIAHFQSMYPEINELLQKKITNKIVQDQVNSKTDKPPYHVRQGLSLLLGTPLSSDTVPGNIQAAQSAFMKQQPSPQQGQGLPRSKIGSKALEKMGSALMTDSQSRQTRMQQS